VIAVLILPTLFYVYREVTRDALIIDPFTVPKRFEDAGLTPDVMANQIGDRLHQIEEISQTRRKKDNLVSLKDEGPIDELEIPGSNLDLKTVIDITRSVLGIYPKHIGGSFIILENDSSDSGLPAVKKQATITVDVSQGRNRSQAISVVGEAGDITLLVQRAAEIVLSQVNPIVLATYLEDHGRYEEAVRTVSGVVGNPLETRERKADAFFSGV